MACVQIPNVFKAKDLQIIENCSINTARSLQKTIKHLYNLGDRPITTPIILSYYSLTHEDLKKLYCS